MGNVNASKAIMDANEATSYVAYKCSEVCAIYPITPSSPMGEFADQWSAEGRKNLWGNIPFVQEMQSEGGAAGAVHGSLQAGSLTSTFTASQGLLLMIPNMYKIAGELTSTVFHIAARSLAAQGLSIFGDHADVMACRSTGFAMLFSNSVQEAMDMALVAHAATLESRVPFIHAFDGFRTSHEVNTIEMIPDEVIRELISDELVRKHRARALNPDHPFIRGTAQNPDIYFQGRESSNKYYLETPAIVQKIMDRLGELTGRHYHLFEYFGHKEAEQVIVIMGSGVSTVRGTIDKLNAEGRKVGVVVSRLYRPFDYKALVNVIPSTVKCIGVLDRTKEPGSAGEPLLQDVQTAVMQAMEDGDAPFAKMPRVVGGRYGLSCKDFTPAMVRGVYDELAKEKPIRGFTVGINDDVTHLSVAYDDTWTSEPESNVRAMFYGMGSDGTVGANKNSIKIIGKDTPNYAQGYFVYDSKKSGGLTISHLRFGPKPIDAPYLIQSANFIAVHLFEYLDRYDVLAKAEEGAVFLLNSPFPADKVWDELPASIQKTILDKKIKMHVIDALTVAREAGMGNRINTVMQTAFFAISNVLPREEAIEHIKASIKKTYGKKGEAVVQKNWDAVDSSIANLHEVSLEGRKITGHAPHAIVADNAPEFVKNITAKMMAERGEELKVSEIPVDGTWPSATTRWEKRNIASECPVWDPAACIQCGKCVMVCPHAAIRSKVVHPDALAKAPASFKSADAKGWPALKDHKFTMQIAVEDCTGCGVCTTVCPTKAKENPALHMEAQRPQREAGRANWNFFLDLPDEPCCLEAPLKRNTVKNVQLLPPMFEFSGACAGCGETAYVKMVSQLFGDRAVIANATGCSSIYGGNLPTTPWCTNKDGRGPAWSNSLFEDNAEFGLGMRISINHIAEYARQLLGELSEKLDKELVDGLMAKETAEPEIIAKRRAMLAKLAEALKAMDCEKARELESVMDALIPRSVWIMGGDGWAYDIGYGGLDHVLAQGENVNVLVLDTEVYSNTGGQASKATPLGAVARFAAAGKKLPKKDLGMIAMSYGNIYVAQISVGANDAQALKAIAEAESYDGPSLVIAYAHCINHGINMIEGLEHQKAAVACGQWPLYRFDPRLKAEGKPCLQVDYKAPNGNVADYLASENRFKQLTKLNPEAAAAFTEESKKIAEERYAKYVYLSQQK
ncbi:MAG: pyruvate:ferredoxin (flavodoxin) oxidoreductase [bacterium]|nr:pyruvate:ferredoxin (flavodoxin) oxidoreductase [bacterium]